jgi:hypothetical protein
MGVTATLGVPLHLSDGTSPISHASTVYRIGGRPWREAAHAWTTTPSTGTMEARADGAGRRRGPMAQADSEGRRRGSRL